MKLFARDGREITKGKKVKFDITEGRFGAIVVDFLDYSEAQDHWLVGGTAENGARFALHMKHLDNVADCDIVE